MKYSNLKILSAYLGLSFLWLLPATVRPTSVLPSGPYSDASQALWAIRNFSWTGSRFSDLAYPPRGVNYDYIDWIGVPNTIVQPVTYLLGSFFAYNLFVWLSLGFTAFGAYHLARLFGAKRWGALLSGFCFGFCPALAGQVVLGHFFYVLGAVFIAPFLYTLLATLRAEKPGKWAVVTLLVWVMLLRTCHYYALFLIPVSIALAAWDLWIHKKSSLKTAVGLLVVGVIVSIAAVLPLLGTGSETEFALHRTNVEFYDADLLGIVTPSPYHPIWGSHFARSGDRVVFCGFTLILLSLWAFGKSPKVLMALWLLASAMSLGPALFVGGERINELPWVRLFDLPGFSEIQVYARAGLVAQLFLAIWVGCAVKSKRMASLAAVFLMFEFLIVPVPIMTAKSDSVLSELKERKMGTVLYVPYEGANTEPLYYQMIHQKAMLRSPVLRPSDDLIRFYDDLPWVTALSDKDGFKKPPSEGPERMIRLTDLRYLVLDKRRLTDEQLAGWKPTLQERFSVDEVLEDETFLIYILSDLSPSHLNTTLRFDHTDRDVCFWGLTPPRVYFGYRVREMTRGEASIWLPAGSQQDYKLQLTTITTESSSASVFWNGELVGSIVGEKTWTETEFQISSNLVEEGANELRIVPAPQSKATWYLESLSFNTFSGS